MILPNLSRWNAAIKLNGAKRDLISNIRLAQQKTVTTQVNHSIQMNPVLNQYSIIEKNKSSTILKTVILPNGITFNSINLEPTVNELEFNASGVPNSVGTISLNNTQGTIKAVEITPSGFIKEL